MTQIVTPDQLIVDIVSRQRQATDVERALLRMHGANAEFHNAFKAYKAPLPGMIFKGAALPSRGLSIDVHLAQRVLLDEEWLEVTTPQEYLRDLQDAFLNARICIAYSQRLGTVLAAIAENSIPKSRLGPEAKDLVYVVYSVSCQAIITGYQCYDAVSLIIGEDAIWL